MGLKGRIARAASTAVLATGMMAATLAAVGSYKVDTYTVRFAANLSVDAARAFMDTNIAKFPIMPFNCAGYVTLAAPLYNGGRQFADADAWDLPKTGPNKLVWSGKASTLEDFSDKWATSPTLIGKDLSCFLAALTTSG